MQLQDLLEELDFRDGDAEVMIEINGVAHTIHSVTDDSQGIYIVVDEALEEREMR
jgi:hypothetical protein